MGQVTSLPATPEGEAALRNSVIKQTIAPLEVAETPQILELPMYGLHIERCPDTISYTLDRSYLDSAVAGEEADEFDIMAREVALGGEVVEGNEHLWEELGFSATIGNRYTEATAPTSAALNLRRAPFIEATGIHSGTFVDHGAVDDDIPAVVFGELLANRQIPSSRTTHDYFVHNPCAATLCEQIFDRFVDSAGLSVVVGTEKITERIVSGFDTLTAGRGLLGVDTQTDAELLARVYSRFMHPLAAGIFAAQDIVAQHQTAQALLSIGTAK